MKFYETWIIYKNGSLKLFSILEPDSTLAVFALALLFKNLNFEFEPLSAWEVGAASLQIDKHEPWWIIYNIDFLVLLNPRAGKGKSQDVWHTVSGKNIFF